METSSNTNLEPYTKSVNILIENEDSSEVGIQIPNCGDDLPGLKVFLGSHRKFQIELDGGSLFEISPVATVGSPVLNRSVNFYYGSATRESGQKTVLIRNGRYTVSVVEQPDLPGQDKSAPKIRDIFVPERTERIGWIETNRGEACGKNSRIFVTGTSFKFQMTRCKVAGSPFSLTVWDETNTNAVAGIGSETQWTQTYLTYYSVPVFKGSKKMTEFQFTIGDNFDPQTEAVLFASCAAVVHDRLEFRGGILRDLFIYFVIIASVIYFIVRIFRGLI